MVVRRRVIPTRGIDGDSFSWGKVSRGGRGFASGWHRSWRSDLHPARSTEGPCRPVQEFLAIQAALTLPGGGVEVALQCRKHRFVVGGAHVMNISTGQQKQMRTNGLMPVSGRAAPNSSAGSFPMRVNVSEDARSSDAGEGLRMITHCRHRGAPLGCPSPLPSVTPETGAVDLVGGAVVAILVSRCRAEKSVRRGSTRDRTPRTRSVHVRCRADRWALGR